MHIIKLVHDIHKRIFCSLAYLFFPKDLIIVVHEALDRLHPSDHTAYAAVKFSQLTGNVNQFIRERVVEVKFALEVI